MIPVTCAAVPILPGCAYLAAAVQKIEANESKICNRRDEDEIFVLWVEVIQTGAYHAVPERKTATTT